MSCIAKSSCISIHCHSGGVLWGIICSPGRLVQSHVVLRHHAWEIHKCIIIISSSRNGSNSSSSNISSRRVVVLVVLMLMAVAVLVTVAVTVAARVAVAVAVAVTVRVIVVVNSIFNKFISLICYSHIGWLSNAGACQGSARSSYCQSVVYVGSQLCTLRVREIYWEIQVDETVVYILACTERDSTNTTRVRLRLKIRNPISFLQEVIVI